MHYPYPSSIVFEPNSKVERDCLKCDAEEMVLHCISVTYEDLSVIYLCLNCGFTEKIITKAIDKN